MFKDRIEAGDKLSDELVSFKDSKDTVVLGITRGGVIVADRISKRLNLPLDIIVVKKIGAPFNPELAIGAVGPGKSVYWEERFLEELNIHGDYKKQMLAIKRREARKLEKYLLGKRKALPVKNKTVILVDDGVATGATVLGTLPYLRAQNAKEVILAAPVIAKDTYDKIVKYFDSIVAIYVPFELNAVGQFYQKFTQVENEEVKDIIRKTKL